MSRLSNHLYRNTHTHRFSKGGPERIPSDGTLIRNTKLCWRNHPEFGITIWLNPYHNNQSFQLSIIIGVTNPCRKYEFVLIFIGNTNPHSEYQSLGEKWIKAWSVVPNKTRQEIPCQNYWALIRRILRFPILVFHSINAELHPSFLIIQMSITLWGIEAPPVLVSWVQVDTM